MIARMAARRMKSVGTVVLVALLVGYAAGLWSAGALYRPGHEARDYQVLRVIDGDTIVVDNHGYEMHVRLLRINTPEKNEPGFQQAKAYLQQLIGRRRVRLAFERDKPEKDRYGRMLCYVWLNDGTLLNAAMVQAGHSKFVTRFGRGRYAHWFEQAEAESQGP